MRIARAGAFYPPDPFWRHVERARALGTHLESERVARAKSDGHHVFVRHERLPQGHHAVGRPRALWHSNLEAVLARVTAASHEALLARNLHRHGRHEAHLRQVRLGQRLQHLGRLGALQRQDAVVGQRLDGGVAALGHKLLEVLLKNATTDAGSRVVTF
eukprot:4554458-Pleurochrysis_carterae.AAC.3